MLRRSSRKVHRILHGQRPLEARDTTFVILTTARVKRLVGSASNEVATSSAPRRGRCYVLDRFCSDKTCQRRSGRDAVSGSHVVSILVSLKDAIFIHVMVQEAPSQIPGGRSENQENQEVKGGYIARVESIKAVSLIAVTSIIKRSFGMPYIETNQRSLLSPQAATVGQQVQYDADNQGYPYGSGAVLENRERPTRGGLEADPYMRGE
jgi:hypothetical protein